MVIYNKSSIHLKNGFEYEDYIIKANEIKSSYDEICDFLGLTLEQARARYDRVFNLAIEDVGTIKRSAVARSGGTHETSLYTNNTQHSDY